MNEIAITERAFSYGETVVPELSRENFITAFAVRPSGGMQTLWETAYCADGCEQTGQLQPAETITQPMATLVLELQDDNRFVLSCATTSTITLADGTSSSTTTGSNDPVEVHYRYLL